MIILLSISSIIIGYLIGSIPSSYLVARVRGKIDLREEGARHVSATAVYRRLGWGPFIFTIFIDLFKGMVAIVISNLLTHSPVVATLTAIAVATGHCWSIFIGFYGGLGAVVIYGMLLYLVPIEFLITGILALIAQLSLKRSDIATYLWLVGLSIALFIEGQGPVIALLPLALLVVQILKRILSRDQEDEYKDNIISDFKRVKKD